MITAESTGSTALVNISGWAIMIGHELGSLRSSRSSPSMWVMAGVAVGARLRLAVPARRLASKRPSSVASPGRSRRSGLAELGRRSVAAIGRFVIVSVRPAASRLPSAPLRFGFVVAPVGAVVEALAASVISNAVARPTLRLSRVLSISSGDAGNYSMAALTPVAALLERRTPRSGRTMNRAETSAGRADPAARIVATVTVLIAGGGIAGLTTALTCHQIGVDARVLESVRTVAPLGVGINLQPNAIRELFELGFADELDLIGVEADEWTLVGRSGNDVWSERRGRSAGYRWPQYSVHRGKLQMLLYRAVLDRLGPDSVLTGHRVTGYRNTVDGVVALVDTRDGNVAEFRGSVLLAADGLHSAVRAQMHPDQPEPQWGGQVLWRGATYGPPIRSGAGFTLVGTLDQRFVHYPISSVDPGTGLQLQNWIAELTVDTGDRAAASWNKQVDVDTFLPAFDDWTFDWLDIPTLVRSTPAVWEYPMVDRDPVDHWVDERTCLIGDAAHVMYPVGSNGASQAIVDARVMGAEFIEAGVGPAALRAFEEKLLEPMSELVLRNRGHGPIGILGIVDERCGGWFDHIDDVIDRSEVEEFMSNYKAAAGFAIDSLNAAPPTIAPGSTVGS